MSKSILLVFYFSILISLSILIVNKIEATSITPSLSIASTRDNFWLSSGDLIAGHNPTSYDPPISKIDPSCIDEREIVIYVHGWNADELGAIDQFNTVRASLKSLGYTQPIIGFSWDSNTIFNGFNPFDWFDAFDWTDDWQTAKEIAEKNGPKLAKLILDLKSSCANAKIHLVGHSLGASVILNALDRLHNDQRFAAWNSNNKNYRVESVHLLGAAVNPKVISTTQGFGNVIKGEVNEFYNKYSTEDDILETAYRNTEGNIALGEGGAQGWQSGLQGIYHQQEVSSEISQDSNGDGIKDKDNLGDNHMGYAGVVNQDSENVTSDGVMDLLINEWR